MDNNQKEKLIKTIEFLKKVKLSNREEIAKRIGEQYHSAKFVNIVETLVDYGIIRQTKLNVYKITPNGERFESFEKLEEENSLQIRLAKSNLEANEFQKKIAKRNTIAMWLNIAIGALNVALLAWQLLKAL